MVILYMHPLKIVSLLMKKYQICKKCVIDNSSYQNVIFNNKGICSYCLNFEKNIQPLITKNLQNKNYAIELKKN